LSVNPEGNIWLNPDTDVGAARHPGALYRPMKEWNVIVVNDMKLKLINAMANPGKLITLRLLWHNITQIDLRPHHCGEK